MSLYLPVDPRQSEHVPFLHSIKYQVSFQRYHKNWLPPGITLFGNDHSICYCQFPPTNSQHTSHNSPMSAKCRKSMPSPGSLSIQEWLSDQDLSAWEGALHTNPPPPPPPPQLQIIDQYAMGPWQNICEDVLPPNLAKSPSREIGLYCSRFLRGNSATLLTRCLSHFKAIGKV